MAKPPQNVAHVRPILQSTVPDSTCPAEPAHLYQMVTINMNGVQKNVMVPVNESEVIANSTAKKASVTTVSVASVITSPVLKTAQSIIVNSPTRSVPVLKQAPLMSVNLGKNKQVKKYQLVNKQVLKSMSVSDRTSSILSSMPKLSAAPTETTASVVKSVVMPNTSSREVAFKAGGGNSSDKTLMGYLVGNQLILSDSRGATMSTKTISSTRVLSTMPTQLSQTKSSASVTASQQLQQLKEKKSKVKDYFKIESVFSLADATKSGNSNNVNNSSEPPEVIEIIPDSDEEDDTVVSEPVIKPTPLPPPITQISLFASPNAGCRQSISSNAGHIQSKSPNVSSHRQSTSSYIGRKQPITPTTSPGLYEFNPRLCSVKPVSPRKLITTTATTSTTASHQYFKPIVVKTAPKQPNSTILHSIVRPNILPVENEKSIIAWKHKKNRGIPELQPTPSVKRKQTARKSTSKSPRISSKKTPRPFKNVRLYVPNEKKLVQFKSFKDLKTHFSSIKNGFVEMEKMKIEGIVSDSEGNEDEGLSESEEVTATTAGGESKEKQKINENELVLCEHEGVITAMDMNESNPEGNGSPCSVSTSLSSATLTDNADPPELGSPGGERSDLPEAGSPGDMRTVQEDHGYNKITSALQARMPDKYAYPSRSDVETESEDELPPESRVSALLSYLTQPGIDGSATKTVTSTKATTQLISSSTTTKSTTAKTTTAKTKTATATTTKTATSLLSSPIKKSSNTVKSLLNASKGKQVFTSQGRNIVVTPTGQKTVIQPTAGGPDKGKFLMIKTNAGTFLVPVNPNNQPAKVNFQSDKPNIKVVSSIKEIDPQDRTMQMATPAMKSAYAVKSSSTATTTSTNPTDSKSTNNQSARKRAKSKSNVSSATPSLIPASDIKKEKVDEPPIKRTKTKDLSVEDRVESNAPVVKESSSDRIKRLKEQLRKQKEEAEKAKEMIQGSKHNIELIDL